MNASFQQELEKQGNPVRFALGYGTHAQAETPFSFEGCLKHHVWLLAP
jgi:hypothetical protein